MSTIPGSTTQSTTANQPTTQPPATTNQAVRRDWTLPAVHATIDSTCDKVGTLIIGLGNLVGGPIAAAGLSAGIDHAKATITANSPNSAPQINLVLDVVKVPLTVAVEACAPSIAEASVMMAMPVSRACSHGAVNIVEKTAEFSRKCCS